MDVFKTVGFRKMTKFTTFAVVCFIPLVILNVMFLRDNTERRQITADLLEIIRAKKEVLQLRESTRQSHLSDVARVDDIENRSPYKNNEKNLNEKLLRYKKFEFWDKIRNLANKKELFPENFDVKMVEDRLRTATILNVTGGLGGTSFKWVLMLEGQQRAVFKPQLVPPRSEKSKYCNAVHEQPRYEIAGVHLMRLFGSRAVTFVAGRKINLTSEVIPYADKSVLSSIKKYNNGTVCLLHKCNYCPSEREFCSPDGVIEGVVIFWLKHDTHYKFGTKESPYHLFHSLSANSSFVSYGLNDHRHCDYVRSDSFYKQDRFFLDMVDMSIMSYLFAHEDEKHLYTVDGHSRPLLTVHLDHGMAFCEQELQAKRILAPVYQCCRVRENTIRGLEVARKTMIQDFAISTSNDILYPILDDEQLRTIQRRIEDVLNYVKQCQTVVDTETLFDRIH